MWNFRKTIFVLNKPLARILIVIHVIVVNDSGFDKTSQLSPTLTISHMTILAWIFFSFSNLFSEYNYLFVNVILLFDIYDRLTAPASRKKEKMLN